MKTAALDWLLEQMHSVGIDFNEIVHDDSKAISNLLHVFFNHIYDSKEMWHKTKNIKANFETYLKTETPLRSSSIVEVTSQ